MLNMKQVLPDRLGEWPTLRIRPTIAYRSEPPPVHRHALAINSFYSFWLIESGAVELSGKFGKIRLKKGDWIFFPPFLSKRQDFEEKTRILSLGFEASWSGQIPWMEFDAPITGRAGSQSSLIAKAGNVLSTFRVKDRGVPVQERSLDAAGIARLQSRLFSFLESLTSLVLAHGGKLMLSEAYHPRLAPLISGMRLKPSVRPLPFAHWKQMLGLSRVQIDRLFRAELGSSPKDFSNRFLLAALKRELVTGCFSLKELAAQFDFSDSSHLCRWFRRNAGMSPEEFRFQGIE